MGSTSKPPGECEACKEMFTPKYTANRFCSKSCAARVSNSTHPRRKKAAPKTRVERVPSAVVECEHCGESLENYHGARVSCDKPKCRFLRNYLHHPMLDAWLAGEYSATKFGQGRHGAVLHLFARCWLLSEHDWSCSRCGWNELCDDTQLPPLEVDHIDGDTFNNFKSNLRLLCPNCHALTPTYRRKNEKNRRGADSIGAVPGP